MAVSPFLTATLIFGFVVVVFLFALGRGVNWRQYVPSVGEGGGEERTDAEERAAYTTDEKPSGLVRWLTTVDHKDIGLMYGVYAIVAFLWAGIAVVLMRLELLTPATSFLQPTTYNSLLTTHGITMLFLFGTPAIAAFSNYFVPLLIGADDMAFPRINAIAFWLLIPGGLLIWAGFFLQPITGGEIAAAQTSWTMYVPLSAEQAAGGAGPNPGADLMLLGLHLSGIATSMAAINFIVTIVTERGDDVTWANLDIFSWTVLTQSGLVLFAFPLLGSAIIMLLLDRNFATTFFAVDGGSPLLWQHLFWFFGHPEVYILVLPPMGLVSYILPRFSGRKLFGFKFVVYSTLAIGVLSFGVWAHHMFATGIDPRLRASFMAVSLAIAVPSAVKTFNWITTMWNGKLRLTAPMLFCIGFISNFIIGGVTGVFLAAVPVDLVLHDTYYVVGHFHYIVMGSIGFAVFAGIYYWFPIVTGRMYQRTLAKWHFWLSMIGTNVTFFSMLLLGYLGMPRRYATYEFTLGPLAQVTTYHRLATLGALLLAFGQAIWVWNIVDSWYEGQRVRDEDPWGLKREAPRLFGREFQWAERNRVPTAADGSGEAVTGEAETAGTSQSTDQQASEED